MRTKESELEKIYETLDLQDAEGMAAKELSFQLLTRLNINLPYHYKVIASLLMVVSEFQRMAAAGEIEIKDSPKQLKQWKENNFNVNVLMADLEAIESFFERFGHLGKTSWQNL